MPFYFRKECPLNSGYLSNRWDDGTEYPDPHSVTHWREMPAAPQQEVK
ncbi:DUF551 domain-containing protein [Escherichia coli]|nr:DUF551 domain-containing protein [Escherichia coli]